MTKNPTYATQKKGYFPCQDMHLSHSLSIYNIYYQGKNIMSRTIQLLMALFLSFFISNLSLAGIYKWTDDQGNVHYSDEAPDKAKSEILNPDTAIPDGTEDARTELDRQTMRLNKEQEEQKKAEEAVKAKEAAEAKRKQDCIALRKNLHTYLTENRVATKVDGQTAVIPYEQRLEKMEQIQKQIETVCKGL